MPKGEHPNSRANLKRGNIKTQFKKGDPKAAENGRKGTSVQTEMKSIAEELKELLGKNDGRKVLASVAYTNALESSKWFELLLKLIGEMPVEVQTINVNAPNSNEVNQMLEELKTHAKKRSSKAAT